jgi:hypothetical protein
MRGTDVLRAEALNMSTRLLLIPRSRNPMIELLQIDACNFSIFAIEDLGHLFESRSSGFNVQEADEKEFEEDPHLEQ